MHGAPVAMTRSELSERTSESRPAARSTRHTWLVALALTALIGPTQGCWSRCDGNGEYTGNLFDIRFGRSDDSSLVGPTVRAPNWGGRTTGRCVDCRPGRLDTVWVKFPVRVELEPDVDLVEFYLDGTALASLPGRLTRAELDPGDVAAEGGEEGPSCLYDWLEYRFSELPPGLYTVVHRRSSAPDGLELSDISYGRLPWDTFEGEDALFTTVSGDGRDYVPPDAGP